jgi:hypothetical protein
VLTWPEVAWVGAKQIAETAASATRDAELIVVGNKGLQGAKGFILGSVPETVIERAGVMPRQHPHAGFTYGRATGALWIDRYGAEHRQRARAVVVCANGIGTPRLLLLSASAQHPDGLAGPHPFAIAHHLLGRWLHGGTAGGA